MNVKSFAFATNWNKISLTCFKLFIFSVYIFSLISINDLFDKLNVHYDYFITNISNLHIIMLVNL